MWLLLTSPLPAASQEITRLMGPDDPLLSIQNVFVGDLKLDHAGNVYMYSSQSVIRFRPSGSSELLVRLSIPNNAIILGDDTVPAKDENGSVINLYPIRDMDIDSDGNIYLAGRNTNNVVKITPEGQLQQLIDAQGDGLGNTFSRPGSVDVDSAGRVYVVDDDNNKIFLIEDGDITQILGPEGIGDSIFRNYAEIHFDQANNAYIASPYAVFKRTLAGEITELVSDSDLPTLLGPGNSSLGQFAIDDLKNLYLTSSISDTLYRLSPEGQLEQIIDFRGDGSGDRVCQVGPWEIVTCETFGNYFGSIRSPIIDPGYGLIVSGGSGHNIFKIDPRGNVSQVMDLKNIPGFSVQHLSSPVMDAAGNYYFVSAADKSVFRIAPLPIERAVFNPQDPPHTQVQHDTSGVNWIPNSYSLFWYTPEDSTTVLDTRVTPFEFSGPVSASLNYDEIGNPNSAGDYRLTSSSGGVTQDLQVELASSSTYGRSRVSSLSYTRNGEITFRAIGLDLPFSNFLAQENQFLMRWILLGNDLLRGAAGDDILYGYDGHDIIYGMAGNDSLSGGRGIDWIYGGDGEDTAWYELSSEQYALSRSPSTGTIQVQPKIGYGPTNPDYIAQDVEYIAFSDRTIATDSIDYWGQTRINEPAPSNQPDQPPVYRFFNVRHNAFFFTTSESEKYTVIQNSAATNKNDQTWPFVFQGAQFKPASSYSGSVPLYRFYNYRTGHHFFTASESEKTYVQNQIEAAGWTFNYEGIAFSVYPDDPNPDSSGLEIPVYRFYSPDLNRHFFTANVSELQELQQSGLWVYEGIGFYGESLYK